MTTPLFSVIVPTHDRPEELGRALSCLVGQTCRDFEVVVVNDGAADVADVIRASGLERMVALRTAGNLGPSPARNLGLAAATGEIVAYLDDDDVYRPDHLAVHAARYARTPGTDVVYSDAERVVAGGGAPDVPHSRDFDADALLVENYIPILCLSYRRACLRETGLFEPSLNYLEDWDLFIRLALRRTFAHERRITAAYFERGTGQSLRERGADRFVESLNAVYARSETWLGHDPVRLARVRDLRLRRVGEMTFDTDGMCEGAGDTEGAARAYALAARYEPKPQYYLAAARTLKRLGRRSEALAAMRLAEANRAQDGADEA